MRKFDFEVHKGFRAISNFDFFLFFTVLALSIYGMIVMKSALSRIDGGDSLFLKHCIISVLGLFIAIVISVFDYNDFKILGTGAYIVTTALLVYVIKWGTGFEETGTNGWISWDFLPFSIQPSEFAKITFVMVVAIFFEKSVEEFNIVNLGKLLFVSFLPIVLILLQPDVGTSLVYIFMFVVMTYVCGIKYKYIISAFIAFLISMPILWLYVLDEFQKDRVLVFLRGAEFDPQGASYQTNKALKAIGSGMVFGRGYRQGVAIQNVPKYETDFIFSLIGEEFGFAGSIILLTLALMFILRCIYIAIHSKNLYGALLSIGLCSMFIFHFFENISMNIGLMPVTGIPLPFISYGGSALLSNFVAIGVILSVSMRRNKKFFE